MNKKYEKVKNWYNTNTEIFAKNSGVLLCDHLKFFESLISKKGRILDIGCGPGHDTEYFAKKGFDAIGVDFSEKMIEFSRKNRKGGIFKRINMIKVGKSFSKNYFNGIWASSSITHLEDTDIINMLKQLRYILAEGGILAVIVKKRMKKKLKAREILFREFYKKDIVKLLKLAKFSKIKINEFKALGKKWLFIVAGKY